MYKVRYISELDDQLNILVNEIRDAFMHCIMYECE